MLGMKLNRNDIRPHSTAYGTPSTSSSTVSARAAAAPSARPDLDVRDELGREGVVAGDDLGRRRPQGPVVEARPRRAARRSRSGPTSRSAGDRRRERRHDAARDAEGRLRLDRRQRAGRDAGDGPPGVLRRSDPGLDLASSPRPGGTRPRRSTRRRRSPMTTRIRMNPPTVIRIAPPTGAGRAPAATAARAGPRSPPAPRTRAAPNRPPASAIPTVDDDDRRGDEQRPAQLADGVRRRRSRFVHAARCYAAHASARRSSNEGPGAEVLGRRPVAQDQRPDGRPRARPARAGARSRVEGRVAQRDPAGRLGDQVEPPVGVRATRPRPTATRPAAPRTRPPRRRP